MREEREKRKRHTVDEFSEAKEQHGGVHDTCGGGGGGGGGKDARDGETVEVAEVRRS